MLERLLVEPEQLARLERADGRDARRAREEPDLAEELAGTETVDLYFAPVGAVLVHADASADDDEERVRVTALAQDRLARQDAHRREALGDGGHLLARRAGQRLLGVLQVLDVTLGVEHRRRRVPRGRRDLLRELRARVTDRVDAGDARAHVLVGDEVVVRVVVDVLLLEEEATDRLEADEDEHPLDGNTLGLPIPLDLDPLNLAVPPDALHDGRRHRLDLVHAEETVAEDRLRAELVAPVDDVQLLREAREEEALLERRVAAADDGQVHALEERAIADGAVGDTLAVELLLARHLELLGLAAHRDDHGVRRVTRPVLEFDDLAVRLAPDLLDALQLDLQAELLCVLAHLLGEVEAGDGFLTRPVLDEVGVEELAPDARREQDRVHVRAGRVQSGGEARGAAADDRSEEHTSELQSRENLVCRLLLEKKKKKIILILLIKKKKQ